MHGGELRVAEWDQGSRPDHVHHRRCCNPITPGPVLFSEAGVLHVWRRRLRSGTESDGVAEPAETRRAVCWS